MSFLKNKIFWLNILSLFLLAVPVVFLNISGFFLFILSNSFVWKKYFEVTLEKKVASFFYNFLAVFAIFTLLGLIASIFVVFYSLNSSLLIYPFVISSVITYFICWKNLSIKVFFKKDKFWQEKKYVYFLIALFVFLSSFALVILFRSQSIEILTTPWQVIPLSFLYLFFALALLASLLLLVVKNYKITLLLFILFSFVIHAYLPLSHALPWGGDVWRHMAVEKKMIDSGLELPVLFGNESLSRTIFGISVPEVFLIPNKYTYGHLWATSVLLTESLHIDLISINKWLVPILWSIFIPIFIYLLGLVKKSGKSIPPKAFCIG
jgi:hypothetical protein